MQTDNSFIITVKPTSALLFSEGPIPLAISALYKGVAKTIIPREGGNFFRVEFETPDGWIPKEKATIQHLNGITPEFSLITNESFTQIVYLHDYFNEIKPGKVILPLTISFWLKQDTAAKKVTEKITSHLTIEGPDMTKFTDRIHHIYKKIKTNADPENLFELYNSIVNLIHPDIISILLGSLLDVRVLSFHATARIRLVELSQQYSRREDIIEYLAKHGSSYDSQFFTGWQEKKIRLSEQEIERLCQSQSLWTRIFCLENYPGPYNRLGVVASIKTEVSELSERVQKLK